MSSDIIRRRRQEVVAELECASGYFERILAEKEFEQLFQLSVAEQQAAQRIYENILYLQWRLAASSRMLH
jgi:hypothetical protein